MVEGILYRYRCGIAFRDVSEQFGPWQTVWKRHRRYSADGTWERVLAAPLAEAQKVQLIDWAVSVDSNINRAYQQATNFARDTGGGIELHESVRRAGRSRGGLSSKIHTLFDGSGRPLVLLVGPSQSGDAPMFPHLTAPCGWPAMDQGGPGPGPGDCGLTRPIPREQNARICDTEGSPQRSPSSLTRPPYGQARSSDPSVRQPQVSTHSLC